MNTETNILKTNLHKFIDQIEDQTLLENYYELMKKILKQTENSAWDKLTDDQKREVLLSYEESEIEDNLVEDESVMRKYKDWL